SNDLVGNSRGSLCFWKEHACCHRLPPVKVERKTKKTFSHICTYHCAFICTLRVSDRWSPVGIHQFYFRTDNPGTGNALSCSLFGFTSKWITDRLLQIS